MPAPTASSKATITKPTTSTSTEPSDKKLFLRDRIAKKKEIEDAELGAEENESNEKNELFVKDDHVGGWTFLHYFQSKLQRKLSQMQTMIYSEIRTS